MALIYSCCFWFSLRLGGILIGLFSLIQALSILPVLCVVYKDPQNVRDQVSELMNDMNLIYVNGFLENFQSDPVKYIGYCIIFICIYIILCLLYVYGAYKCNNALMFAFISVELVRLIILSITVTTWLLVLKQNTMDIGLIIGASVICGFILLGMFYLWVCAANLPILINEMVEEEHKATIVKLQKLLETKNKRFKQGYGESIFENMYKNGYNTELFVISRDRKPLNGVQLGDRYYSTPYLR